MMKRHTVQKGMKSYSDKLVSNLWSIVGYSAIVTTLLCLGILLIQGINAWEAMLVFALVIVPCIEIAHGIVMNEKSIMWGGSLGLLAGIFTMCCMAGGVPLNASWFMPIFIGAFACMMIIPGHIINHKAKNIK